MPYHLHILNEFHWDTDDDLIIASDEVSDDEVSDNEISEILDVGLESDNESVIEARDETQTVVAPSEVIKPSTSDIDHEDGIPNIMPVEIPLIRSRKPSESILVPEDGLPSIDTNPIKEVCKPLDLEVAVSPHSAPTNVTGRLLQQRNKSTVNLKEGEDVDVDVELDLIQLPSWQKSDVLLEPPKDTEIPVPGGVSESSESSERVFECKGDLNFPNLQDETQWWEAYQILRQTRLREDREKVEWLVSSQENMRKAQREDPDIVWILKRILGENNNEKFCDHSGRKDFSVTKVLNMEDEIKLKRCSNVSNISETEASVIQSNPEVLDNTSVIQSNPELPFVVKSKMLYDKMGNSSQSHKEYFSPPSVSQSLCQPKSLEIIYNKIKTQLRVENDILYYVNNKRSVQPKLVPFIPETYKLPVIRYFHGSVNTGHFGVTRTYNLIRNKFFWLKLKSTISIFFGN